ncbi:TetR/AcrR family transcriptional regulator [Streptomyces venezuelae ATCC 10712]
MPTSETGGTAPDPFLPPDGASGAAVAGTGAAARSAVRAPVDRKRQPSGDEARGRAMRAAISVIAEKGTAALRMSDIATRAGMSTGHILYHFGKKDRLLLEVLAWSQADLWDQFQRAVDAAASPEEKLDLFVRFYLPRHQGDERYALWTQVLAQRHDEEGGASSPPCSTAGTSDSKPSSGRAGSWDASPKWTFRSSPSGPWPC